MDKILQFLEIFGWSAMSIAEKTEIVRNLGLITSVIIGVFFLAWRAISNDKMARAALKQAKIASDQLNIASSNIELQAKQIESTRRQIEILSENADLSSRSFEETVKNNSFGRFQSALSSLAEADSEAHRSVAMILVGESAKENIKFLSPTLSTFENMARMLSPSTELVMGHKTILRKLEKDDVKGKVTVLKELPLALWIDLKPNLYQQNPYDKLQLLDIEKALSDEQVKFVNLVWDFFTSIPSARIAHFWYKHLRKAEMQTMVDVLSEIKHKYPDWPIPLSGVKLDGCNFTVKNFSHAQFTNSSLRGAECFQADFSNIIAVACDFSSSWMSKADFSNSDISSSDFSECVLSDVTFDNADVAGCHFHNCVDFDESMLRQAKNADQAVIS